MMLGLAVGIDYALFIVTRFRQELRRGRTVPDAAAMAVGTAGSAVVTAGLTVVIALAGLSVAGIPFLTEMGLAAAGHHRDRGAGRDHPGPGRSSASIGLRALPRKARERSQASPAPSDDGRGFYPAAGRTRSPGSAGSACSPRWPRWRWSRSRCCRCETSLVQKPAAGQHPGQGRRRSSRAASAPASPGRCWSWSTARMRRRTRPTVRQQVAALPGVAVATAPQPNPAGTAALITVIPATGPDEHRHHRPGAHASATRSPTGRPPRSTSPARPRSASTCRRS